MEKDLTLFEKSLKLKFKNKSLLQQAFVHRSYLNEHKSFELDHNERLEFLGDAVLELVVTEYLYINYSNPEGELTNWRASLVNGNMLAKIARDIGMNDFLYLSRGEEKDTGKGRDYILANAFEALIGAIYLDRGWEPAKDFIIKYLIPHLSEILEKGLFIDPKTKFQELAQEKVGITPTYKVLDEEGPDHAKIFTVGIYLQKDLIASATGSSKQEAQEKAAALALKNHKW